MSQVSDFSIAEVANHGKGKNIWICIQGNVYDISKFIEEHPGGEEILRSFAGKDATEAFQDAAHSEEVKPIMERLLIGTVPLLVSQGTPQWQNAS
ncbi:uncharacterized protein SETTUDRAFT_94846 [Exserohilum turcica Et28A]|uniref:Cytochrome b5 heme-binding domain-containing protein n=1 Tax=Exserohilum turcicum (strain 28A) TaxID=671987 RepID=R0K071_EXST2|nr:uncharacterized protein SETTUDRAFT_94846 [Exserohilum turcica Et28A]EOA83079.1 hypothetical protein SETTUDRAFT_94846 [Exserohilum turcica Et28A]